MIDIEGTRQRGRRRKSWLPGVEEDMKNAQGHSKWMKKIEGETG